MNFSVDWGTFVISVPVIAATCFGAIKYIGQTYSKEYFDKRLETYKVNLQKEMEEYKSGLEIERSEYIKKLDLEIERNRLRMLKYTELNFSATQSIEEVIRDAYNFLETVDSDDESIYSEKYKSLKTLFDVNKNSISKELAILVKDFVELFKQTYISKLLRTHRISAREADYKIKDAFEGISAKMKQIRSLQEEIDNQIRIDLAGI